MHRRAAVQGYSARVAGGFGFALTCNTATSSTAIAAGAKAWPSEPQGAQPVVDSKGTVPPEANVSAESEQAAIHDACMSELTAAKKGKKGKLTFQEQVDLLAACKANAGSSGGGGRR
jgi:hypothetical protein